MVSMLFWPPCSYRLFAMEWHSNQTEMAFEKRLVGVAINILIAAVAVASLTLVFALSS